MNAVHLITAGFDWTLRTTWSASILIGLVFLLQWLLRDKLAPRWRYALWLVVLVRLVVPITPESAVSLFNFAKVEAKRSEISRTIEPTLPVAASQTTPESEPGALAELRPSRRLAEMTGTETELRFQVAGSNHSIKAPQVIYWAGLAIWAAVSLILLSR